MWFVSWGHRKGDITVFVVPSGVRLPSGLSISSSYVYFYSCLVLQYLWTGIAQSV